MFERYSENARRTPFFARCEAQLPGVYDLEPTSTVRTVEAFIDALREEAGLIVTPATRDVTHLVVRRG